MILACLGENEVELPNPLATGNATDAATRTATDSSASIDLVLPTLRYLVDNSMDSVTSAVNSSINAVTPTKKILFVLTSADKFLNGKPTGWYLPEMAHPYYECINSGYTVDVASPNGGKAPLDPSSVESFKSDPQCTQFLNDSKAQNLVNSTMPLYEIQHTGYEAIFYVGGHGPCFDLYKDINSIELLQKFIQAGKPVSAVCHGPIVFTQLVNPDDGSYFVKGKAITCFTDVEEEQAGLTKAIPFLVESKLKELGANFENAKEPWGEHVVRDGQMITGQNPASAGKTARVLIQAIEGKQTQKCCTESGSDIGDI